MNRARAANTQYLVFDPQEPEVGPCGGRDRSHSNDEKTLSGPYAGPAGSISADGPRPLCAADAPSR